MLSLVFQSLIVCIQATVHIRASRSDSALHNANLTELSMCLSQLGESLTLHSNFGESGKESLVVDIATEGRDQEDVEAMDPSSGFIFRVYDCLEKQKVYKPAVLHFGDDSDEFEWFHLTTNDQQAIFSYESDAAISYTSELSKRAKKPKGEGGHGPVVIGANPFLRLDLAIIINAGEWFTGKKLGSLDGPDCGKCYSFDGKVGSSAELRDFGNSYSFMYWPHHCCRSVSKPGDKGDDGKEGVKNRQTGLIAAFTKHSDRVFNGRIGSLWIQCPGKTNWPNDDSREDLDPCIEVKGSGC